MKDIIVPHREKIAWLSLIAILAGYIPYFTLAAVSPPPPGVMPNLHQLALLAIASTTHAVLYGLGRLWFRLGSPQDARGPADERDRAIERRSTTIAYYVLIAGVILCVARPFTASGWQVVNAALLAIVAAEVVHYGVAVWNYRWARA